MADSDPKKLPELRVVLGIPGKVGVAADVGHPDRLAVAQKHSQDAVEPGEVADQPGQALADPDGDELVEATPAVGHSEGAVARAGQLASGPQDPLQDAVQVEVAGDRERGLVERLHLYGALAPPALRVRLGWRGHGPSSLGRQVPRSTYSETGQEMLRGAGDLVDRPVEHVGVGLGRLSEAADLADELQRGGADLLVGGGFLGTAKCLDAAAHRRKAKCLLWYES